MSDHRPSYLRVVATFARNSLVRDMTFRANFVIDVISALSWVFMNLGFYILIFRYTPMLGAGTGWGQYEFFAFLATTLLVGSLVHVLFMLNMDEFSEKVRTGTLDFALLKPIDTQFLISFGRFDWSAMANVVFALLLLVYSLWRLHHLPSLLEAVLYPFYIACGIAIFYSLMISLAATSVWLGRNETLYDFWFYITNFARYPMEIYHGRFGTPLRNFFLFVIPVLVAVNVPARLLVRPLAVDRPGDWLLPAFCVFATLMSLVFSRWLFNRALLSYRSASS